MINKSNTLGLIFKYIYDELIRKTNISSQFLKVVKKMCIVCLIKLLINSFMKKIPCQGFE